LALLRQSLRRLDNAELVVWYTFGAHHVVRPEDWPVMPVTHIGFALKPVGFFDRNPALDVPRPYPVAVVLNGPLVHLTPRRQTGFNPVRSPSSGWSPREPVLDTP
jgi:hypothetical protein